MATLQIIGFIVVALLGLYVFYCIYDLGKSNKKKDCRQNKVMTVLLIMAALFAGQTAWAQTRELTLSEDNDFPSGTAGHWYVNMSYRVKDFLTLSATDLTACGYTFKVYDDGGKDGNYGKNSDSRLVITVPEGYALLVTGTIWTKYTSTKIEFLRFAKGNSEFFGIIGEKWLSDMDGEPKTVGPVTCAGNVMCIQFNTDEVPVFAGLDLTVNVVSVNIDYNVSTNTPVHGILEVDKQTAKVDETVTVTPTPDTDFTIAEVSYTVGTMKVVLSPKNGVYSFKMPAYDVSVDAVFIDEVLTHWGGMCVDGSAEHPYVISDQVGYDLLVTKSKTDSYTDKYFELTTDLSGVTTTIGSDMSYPFCGHINGNGHRVTLALESSDNLKTPAMITWAGEGCSVENLTVDGTITMTDGMYGAGFISQAKGAVTLTNCRSSVTITYTKNYGTPHNGGFIGKLENGVSATLLRCLFDGAFISETAQTFGGMVGSGGNITIQNSVVATSSTTSLTSTSNNDNYAFSFPSSSTNLSNNYYVYDASPSHLNGFINRYQGNGQPQAWLLTLTEPATIVRTGGTAIGNGECTIYADGFTLGGNEYFASGVTVTLNASGLSITAANYNGNAAIINPDGTARFTMPTTNTTAAITGFEANYIDADGTAQTRAVSLLSSSNVDVTMSGGWYAVSGDVTLSNGLTFTDAAHLILTDGATLNVYNNNTSIYTSIAIAATDLCIYGQALGTGILNVESKNNATASGSYAYGIKATGSITFCGGQVNAKAIALPGVGSTVEIHCIAICTNDHVTIIRGNVSTIADRMSNHFRAILHAFSPDKDVILDWRLPTDRIHLTIQDEEMNSCSVSVAEGKALWNGSEVLSGGISRGQFNNMTLQPCIAREIEGYDTGNDKWAFIASPVTAENGILPTAVGNIFTAAEYDLYRLNPSNTMWENYKKETHTSDFRLVNGQGYLYATKQTKTLAFMGDAFNTGTAPVQVPLVYDGNNEFAGWNLVGNPFTEEAYVNRPFYKMNDAGTGIVAVENYDNYTTAQTIPTCTGIVVKAEGDNETVTFSTSAPNLAAPNNGSLQITLAQTVTTRGGSSTETLDNAIVSFNEGSQLGKFYFGEQNGNIYIPQNGKDYAIAYSNGQGEMPLCFKARENGEYTLTVSESLNSKFKILNYLHLIDNLTGANIDLLQTPSYTFTARNDDYASRFKLVFNAQQGGEEEDDNFAFISNGEIIVNGEGVLQVIDVMGRTIVSVDGRTRCVPTDAMAPGVYVLQLVNGENVKTQKIMIY
jgi:hypothetical protein